MTRSRTLRKAGHILPKRTALDVKNS